MNLALFDLDHTLIPFDSGMAWTRFLVERGVLPAEAEQTYLDYCRQYVAGTLDIQAMHFASVAPLKLLVAVLQAFIFVMLTMLYISGAIEEAEHSEHH